MRCAAPESGGTNLGGNYPRYSQSAQRCDPLRLGDVHAWPAITAAADERRCRSNVWTGLEQRRINRTSSAASCRRPGWSSAPRRTPGSTCVRPVIVQPQDGFFRPLRTRSRAPEQADEDANRCIAKPRPIRRSRLDCSRGRRERREENGAERARNDTVRWVCSRCKARNRAILGPLGEKKIPNRSGWDSLYWWQFRI